MEKQNSTKTNTLSDKAFCRLMLTALFSTLFIIAIFCGTTYAWFTASTATETNTISTGSFLLDVSVTNSQLETVYSSPEAKRDDRVEAFTLAAGETYTVTLKPNSETNVSKGHATVTIGGVDYVTDTIYANGDAAFSFTVTVTEKTTVKVKASWGMAARPTIVSGLCIQG